ncbi:LuxR C-terminal-related transcriptional regulator [Sinorhizobium meliloti]|uniref:response regulator transcription factor n=1 Tax=Rhizobium meliloti TaxID=382 RepID=UPI00299D1996|nr:DNA-binding response regulator [Sinorhizobium meliloti]MDX0133256.1 DNA-binding response regulator [Sinorhizobium meliloti]MDX0229091.1 DNA-binding response regulator [Sinorhizobium meliloti]
MPTFLQQQHGENAISQTPQEAEKQPGSNGDKRCLLLFDSRALGRECLARTLINHGLSMDVAAFGSIDEWRDMKSDFPPVGAVLLNIGARKARDLTAHISGLAAQFRPAPVVVLSDSDDIAQILQVLESGAQGYIPASVGVDVCIEAIGLAMAGGVFVPASSVLAARHLIATEKQETSPLAGMFTLRQAEVVEALRKGKTNKIIAYELNLRESTVKVHIRNIMKKLKATNRTEVACKLNEQFSGDPNGS